MDIIESAVAYLKSKSSMANMPSSVEGLFELEQAQNSSVLCKPQAYIFLLREKAAPNTQINIISQRVTVTFAVVIAVPDVVAPLGRKSATGANPLADTRNAVLNTMLDWQYTSAYDPTEFNQGRLVLLKNRVVWWQDEFETAYYLRK